MASAIVIDENPEPAPWLVMVHGMSQDHRVFAPQVEAFRSRHRILLIDLPGHGLSIAVPGPYGHIEFARHIREALTAYGVENADYWGTHTGATVALLLAARSPELFRSLVLEGPTVPGANQPVVTQALGRARKTAAAKGLDAALDEWWEESPWFEHMRTHPRRRHADGHHAIVTEFSGAPWLDTQTPEPVTGIEAEIARIATPALIYNGAYDHPDFLASAKEIASLMPNARLVKIPDSGGFPAWENPDTVNERVVDFWETLGD